MDNYPTYNGVFRAYRYASTHPALSGHDLTPGATMTGDTPDYYTPTDLTSVQQNDEYITPKDVLDQNYPNPFSESTTIPFELSESKHIDVIILDFSGSQVKTLVNRTYSKGKYSVEWDGTNENGMKLPGGTYFYVLKANNVQLCKKMILLH